MEKARIIYLVERYTTGSLTGQEMQELRDVMLNDSKGPIVQEALEHLLQTESVPTSFDLQPWQKVVQRIMQVDRGFIGSKHKTAGVRYLWRIAAAAVLILMIGVGGYFYYEDQKRQDTVTSITLPIVRDLPPGSDKAILTLADGSQIELDSVIGKVAREGAITAINGQGQLKYEGTAVAHETAVSYHTISTPRGGQYKLILADGTVVWLNAASSLRFPTAFTGTSRKVELTGEGYFEVAHNKNKPFKVTVNGMEVEVLGTDFNINAYSEEPFVKTTLIQGIVKVRKDAASAVLNPGQQAQLSSANHLKVISDIDTEDVLAWKNGNFSLKGADVAALLRQISRWYDVDVVYETTPSGKQFVGSISREVNLSDVLSALQEYGINARLEGRQIRVQP